MDISLIVLIGFPVLYLTGSLRKAAAAAGIRGIQFVLYFVIATLFSLAPRIPILPGLSLDLTGLFMCVAPVVYIFYHRGYTYHFWQLPSPYYCPLIVLCDRRYAPYRRRYWAVSAGAVPRKTRPNTRRFYRLAWQMRSDSAVRLARSVVLFDIRTMAALRSRRLASYFSIRSKTRPPCRHTGTGCPRRSQVQ